MKRKLIALAADRKAALDAAQAAFEANNQAEYTSQMEKVTNLNAQIDQVKNLIAEQERSVLERTPSEAEAADMAAERGNDLRNRRPVRITNTEIRREILNSVTLTGTLVQPTGAGSEVHGGDSAISSILDMVQVEDFTGLSGWEEPYIISELEADVADPVAKSGQARANSSDPTFGIAQIIPLELSTTSYIDKNIADLSPANYYQKVYAMAMRALRRKAVALIVNGAVQGSKTTFGIKTAVNKAGTSIVKTGTYSAIGVNTLDDLYFEYGADSELGGQAALLLTKQDLKVIGQLRGTNEKQRLFKITPTGNGNTGVIADGGVQIPYILVPSLSVGDLIYGNPMNYKLGLFGDYSIRVDESVKAIERMLTILGDVKLGGNVIEHQGFVYYSKTASGT